MSSTQPEKREQQPIIQRPTRTPSRRLYSQLSNTHVFVPVAIETGLHIPSGGGTGTWKTGANITGDARESTFLFQQLSVALQRGNAVSVQNTFTAS